MVSKVINRYKVKPKKNKNKKKTNKRPKSGRSLSRRSRIRSRRSRSGRKGSRISMRGGVGTPRSRAARTRLHLIPEELKQYMVAEGHNDSQDLNIKIMKLEGVPGGPSLYVHALSAAIEKLKTARYVRLEIERREAVELEAAYKAGQHRAEGEQLSAGLPADDMDMLEGI